MDKPFSPLYFNEIEMLDTRFETLDSRYERLDMRY